MAPKNKNYSLDTFKNSISRMISVSDTSYDKWTTRKGDRVEWYDREEIERLLWEGGSDELRSLSKSFMYYSGFYKRFITYYATLLKYVYLLIPHMRNDAKIEDPKNFSRYSKALEFLNALGPITLSREIAYKVLSEGAYYGILRDFGKDGLAVQGLPPKYCRSRFKNQAGVSIVELRLTYFDSIRDKKDRDEVLKSYPVEVRAAYNNMKNKAGFDWFMFEPEQSLYFTLFDERPFFASILPAILDFGDYRKMEKEKDMQELKSLLIQKLPIEDGELVFDPDEAEEIHRGSVNMLKKNQNTDVLTTFADVKLEEMESNKSVVANNLEKIETSIYSEAGVSKELFAADGNVALTKSITNDTALMMHLAEQIANWLTYNIQGRFGTKDCSFKVTILPISYYNEQDMRKESLSLAQSGYSFLVPMMTMNFQQSDLLDLKNLEMNALHLDEIMTPLSSSFTQSSSGSPKNTKLAKQAVGGELPDDQKTDKTIQNIEANM